MSWEEVVTANREKRRELVLTGGAPNQRIEEHGLDCNIFKLIHLNFLEISKTCMKELPDDLGNLINLTNLALHNNRLSSIPPSIEKLSKLKQLDLSGNSLKDLPEGICHLHEMHTLNLSRNMLESIPDMNTLTKMHVLDISHNELVEIPTGIHGPPLDVLAMVRVNGNKIEEIPSSIATLPQLKLLDISDNKLSEIPTALGDCGKLKDLNFSGNKLKDRRLAKMMDQCTTKSVLDYLRNLHEKEGGKGKGGKKDKKKRKAKRGQDTADHAEEEEDTEVIQNLMQVLHFDEGVTIKVTPAVSEVRPYIVCCVIRKLNFHKSNNMFKRFITLQTKLHDEICNKRQKATIATHDLRAVNSPLTYDARSPGVITVTPLFAQKEITADMLMKKLHDDAEELRRQKKRSSISGIHKYLDLLKDKPMYPVLLDSKDAVISFPPITNSEITKISKDTTDILIEVTSSVTLEICKTVMDKLLEMILETGVGQQEGQGHIQSEAASSADSPDASLTTNQKLVIEQVKVTDAEGNLKVVYPSHTDLQSDVYVVKRVVH